MSGAPAEAEALLRRLGALDDRSELPIAAAALAFARFDRPSVRLEPCHEHLAALAHEVAALAADAATVEAQGAVLREVLAGRHHYAGDEESYDDLDNADLSRVIERRRGLPVALGILYLHAARAQGWRAAGLAFPGHFLIRLEAEGRREILDPFAGGAACDAARLRDLLGAIEPGSALTPETCRAVSDRDVLLRLQNNIKARLLVGEAFAAAAGVIARMLLLAPRHAGLWREAGLVALQLDQLGGAIRALERAIDCAAEPAERAESIRLLRLLRGRLQ